MCIATLSASAQYVSINYDQKTIDAMILAFSTEEAAEKHYTEQVKKIFEKYTTAEIATATIFSSKYLERKALTDLGIWTSSTENYYYKRIYNMVAQKIPKKILIVTQLMMKNPENALYWGSYIIKICEETVALCQQFQMVVTNNRLHFYNANFIQVKPEVKQLFEIAHKNFVNWDRMQQILTEIPSHFTKENLKMDVDNLYKLAQQIAGEIAENVMNRVMNGTNFKDLMEGKISGIQDAVQSCEQVYGNINSLLTGELKRIIGASTNPGKLLKTLRLDESWTHNYVDRSEDQFYTQQWYIYKADSGSEVMVDYMPPEKEAFRLGSPHWTVFNPKDPNFVPDDEELEFILQKSEKQAGWSRLSVNLMNSSNPGYIYTFKSTLIAKTLFMTNGELMGKSFAYAIKVCKTWDNTEIVEEEIFDSYRMDMSAFQKRMQLKLDEWNNNGDGFTYKLASGDKNYYSVSNEEKLKGAENVVISVTCHNSSKLTSGSSSYKCGDNEGRLTPHDRECSMSTSLQEGNTNTSELDAMEIEYRKKITQAQTRINVLEKQNSDMIKQMASVSTQEAAVLRQKINANQDEIRQLKSDIAEYEAKIKEIQAAKEQINKENNEQVDAHNRIPSIMNDCRIAYKIVWEDEGRWSGYTITRHGHIQNNSAQVTFKATLSVARKPEYVLGIKIHRAVIQIDYELTSDASNTSVVEVIALDKEMSDAEKKQLVNDKISEIAQDFPKCQIDTQYLKSEPVEEDTTTDKQHLLWSSDRLEIARGIDARLHNIYADLISIEKMMNYKRSIIDVLLTLAPPVNDEQGKRQTIIQQARKRWLNNAARTSHSGKYNGKYEDTKSKQTK